MKEYVCPICDRGMQQRLNMCRSCSKSYQRDAFESGDVLEALRWAAKRARYFARREPRRRRRPLSAGGREP